MKVKFYLWKADASTDYRPRAMGVVSVDGTNISVQDPGDPELPAFFAQIARYPTLPFRTEEVQPGDGGPVMAMIERQVSPADEEWGLAVSQVASQVGGFDVSFTPDLLPS